MKIPYFIGLSSAIWVFSCQGQAAPANQFQDTPYAVVSEGADQQVWQRTTYETLASGQTVPHIHQYIELATGLNHLVNGQWMTVNTWDNLNRLTSTTYPDGTTISNIYNKLDIVATKDRLNQWTHYGYNAVRQVTAVTNANGQVTLYDYCGCGSPDTITRFNGSTPVVVQFTYDMGGRLTNALYPDNYQIGYTFDYLGRCNAMIDGAGNQWSFSYTRLGLKNLLTGVDGAEYISHGYDPYGRMTSTSDANGITTTNGYDFLDRLFARQTFGSYDQLGLETFTNDAKGLESYMDQMGHVTTYGRDAAGRVLYETNANNEVLQFTYNPADELLTLTDGKNQATKWSYDAFGRVTNKLDAASITNFVYQYDPLDRLTNRWSAARGNTVYRYDSIGNLTNVLYPVSSNIVFRYDPLNRLTNMTDGAGGTVFNWTGGDQLQSEGGRWPNDTVSYTYNGGRQRVGLAVQAPNASPWKQSYTWDSKLRLTQVLSPGGQFGYNYPDGGNRIYQLFLTADESIYIQNYFGFMGQVAGSALMTPNGEAAYFGYSYDQGMELTQKWFTTGNSMIYTYDNIGQLTGAQGSGGEGPRLQEQFGYAYDKAWNLNQRTNNALVETFNVNNLNELTTITNQGTLTVAGTATEYPANLTGVTVSGTGLSSGPAELYGDGTWARTNATPANGNNTYTAIATDTYGRWSTNSVMVNLPATNTYSYDLNGNLLSDGTRYFAYDDENQLVSVTVSNAWRSEFVYDGLLRRRIARDYRWDAGSSGWLKTNEVRYVYDGNLVVQERDQNNLPLVTYTRGWDLSKTLDGAGGIGGLLARTDMGLWTAGSGQATALYFSDGNGNVATLINTNGLVMASYNYDPFGNILSMSGPLAPVNAYRNASKEWNDHAGLYYYGYRFYDPILQRWLNRDPIGEWGGLSLFTFIDNSPACFVDPFGLYQSPTWAQAFVPGQGYWDNAVTAWQNGQYGKSAAWSAAMLAEQALFVATLGECKAPNVSLGATRESFVPEEALQKNAPKQVPPGTKQLEHTKYNSNTGKMEKSTANYDDYGRQTGRTDYTDHGRPNAHTDPHHHTTEYDSGYAPTGKESGPKPGPCPSK